MILLLPRYVSYILDNRYYELYTIYNIVKEGLKAVREIKEKSDPVTNQQYDMKNRFCL